VILHYSHTKRLFWLECSFEQRHVPEAAGFEWHDRGRRWVARSPYTALTLWEYADKDAAGQLADVVCFYRSSKATVPSRDVRGSKLLPYQQAAVEHVLDLFGA
jgi:hypothetical protein